MATKVIIKTETGKYFRHNIGSGFFFLYNFYQKKCLASDSLWMLMGCLLFQHLLGPMNGFI